MKKLYVTTSWDDGHKLDLRLSSLLHKYNLTGTFYVSPFNNEFDQADLLSRENIHTIAEIHDIGAHTLHHVNLRSLGLKEIKEEVVGSKIFLEKLLKKDISMFCYPMGYYNSQIIKIIKEAGFIGSRTVERFSSDPIDRFRIGTSMQVYTHFSDLSKIFSFYKFNPVKTLNNISWNKTAKEYFDYLLKNGGVFHIWGHSWEIEKNQDWNKLEDLFEYISYKKNVIYLSNTNLVKSIYDKK